VIKTDKTHLMRDLNSLALVSADKIALMEYKNKKKVMLDIIHLREEINNLKIQVSELTEIVNTIKNKEY
jgi:hypothetical protein